MFRILIAASILVITATQPACAYIDVAIGSLILQGLIGGFVAFMVVWRDWTSKLKNFFKGNGFVSTVPDSEMQDDSKD